MHLDWIDRYKGLLIILVVMGHVLGGAVRLTQGLSQSVLNNLFLVIYEFHMPAFFYVAGLTWRTRGDEHFGAFVIRKANRLLVPYVVFGVLSTIAYCLLIGDVQATLQNVVTTNYYQGKFAGRWGTCVLGLLHAGGYPNGEGFRMNSVLWFLPCLFTTEVIYRGLKSLIELKGWKLLTVVCVCVALSVWKLPMLPWGLRKAPYYLLFVMLGDLWGKRVLDKCRGACLSVGWLAAGVTGYVVVVLALPDPGLMCRWYWRLVDMALAAVGCVLFAEVARAWNGRWLAACGVASMGIMLIHKFLVVILEIKVGVVRTFLNDGLIAALVGCAVLTFVITAISYVVSKLLQRKASWSLGLSC